MLFMSIALSGVALTALNAKALPTLKTQGSRHLKRLDDRYQSLMRRRVDTLLATQARNRQSAEFNDGGSQREATINRLLGGAAAATATAAIGTVAGLPAFTAASGLISASVLAANAWVNGRQSLKERRVKYRLLGPLSTLIALAAGYYLLVGVMSLIYMTTFKIAARTEAAAQDAMRRAFALQPPQKIWALIDGAEIELPFERVGAGDVIVVDAGATAPVDGVVVAGDGAVDQHALTGESRPVEKTVGDTVLANTIVISGKLYVKIEKTGRDTAAAKITTILTEASSGRPDNPACSERMVDSLVGPLMAAGGAAAVVVGTSGALAIFHGGFSTPLMSGPLCMLSYLNIASNKGVLIKDGRSLETLPNVNAIVFDKTGTLTLEQPRIAEIHAVAPWRADAVLRYAALAEYRQTHPIARAILSAAETAQIPLTPPDEASYAMGMGVTVTNGEQTVHVGSARFMAANGVHLPDSTHDWRAQADAVGGSLVFAAVNRQCVGAIRLEAQLRPGVETLITSVKKRGLKTYILSGDAHQPTAHLAKLLQVDDFFAEVMPEEKASVIKKLQDQGEIVCFVGDGLNDALALQQAEVSISMRGATTLATDSAQIILMNPSLKPIEDVFVLGNQFDRNLTRTMLCAYVPAGTVVGGVFLFGFGMPAAAVLFCAGVTTSVASAIAPMIPLAKQSKKQ